MRAENCLPLAKRETDSFLHSSFFVTKKKKWKCCTCPPTRISLDDDGRSLAFKKKSILTQVERQVSKRMLFFVMFMKLQLSDVKCFEFQRRFGTKTIYQGTP